jgi:hypothetical protein
LLQTGCLKTTEIYSCIVQVSRNKVGSFLGVRGRIFPCLILSFWWSPANLGIPWCLDSISISVLLSHRILSLCLYLCVQNSFSYRPQVILDLCPSKPSIISSQVDDRYLQSPYFQIGLHTQILGWYEFGGCTIQPCRASKFIKLE